MKKVLKSIFAGPETVATAVKAVIDSGDALVMTKEEKSEWFLKYLQVTSPQNVARRFIAFLITGLWVMLILMAVAAQGLGKSDFSDFIFKTLNDIVNQPFSIIIAFYFLTHAIRGRK